MDAPLVILFFVAYCTLAVNALEIKESEWIAMKNLVESQQEMIMDMKQRSLKFESKVMSEIEELKDKLKRQDDEIQSLQERNNILEKIFERDHSDNYRNKTEGKLGNKTMNVGVGERKVFMPSTPTSKSHSEKKFLRRENKVELIRQGTFNL